MPSNWAIAHIRVAARKESYKKQGVADRTGDTLVSPLPLLGCGRSWNESNLFSPWSVDTINMLAHRQPMNEKQRKIKFVFFLGRISCFILAAAFCVALWTWPSGEGSSIWPATSWIFLKMNTHEIASSLALNTDHDNHRCRAATTHLRIFEERRNLIWFSLARPSALFSYFPLLCVGRALRGGPSKEHIPKKRCFPRLGFPATSCVLDVNTMCTRTASIPVDQLPLAAWSELWTVAIWRWSQSPGITRTAWAKTEPASEPEQKIFIFPGHLKRTNDRIAR